MSETIKNDLRSALSLMIKPLVRLFVSQGITHGEFADTVAEVFVETAIRSDETGGKLDLSKIAAVTGLARNEVKAIIQKQIEDGGPANAVIRPEIFLHAWYSDARFTGPYGIPLELPFSSDSGDPSFTELVEKNCPGASPRQIADDLIRSGSVLELEDGLKVLRRNYEPVALSPQLINRLGEIGYRVFSTAAQNIEKKQQGAGHFDRLVVADAGCSSAGIQKFDSYIKDKGQSLLEEIDVWFTNNVPGEGEKSQGTGVYMVHYVEDELEKSSLKSLLKERKIGEDI